MPRSTITAITSAVPSSGRQNGTALTAKAFLARLVNVNGIVYGKVYFPTRSNRLKDLGVAVGASWPTPNPSGIESIAWRYRWEDSGQARLQGEAACLQSGRLQCPSSADGGTPISVEGSRLAGRCGLYGQAEAVGYADRRGDSSSPLSGIINSAHLDYPAEANTTTHARRRR